MQIRFNTGKLDLDGSPIKRVWVFHLLPSRERQERFFLSYRSSIS